MGSGLLFALGTKVSLVAGLALQVLAMAMLDVVINLYMLDHIPRRGLNHFEPRRLLFAGSAFARARGSASICNRNVAESLTYIVAALSTLTLLTFSGHCGWPTTPVCRPQRHRRRTRSVSCRDSFRSRVWCCRGCWRSAATGGG